MNPQQYEKVKSAKGFIAALDQSGGSSPKALSLYGIKPEAYSGEQQMFDLIHAMRTRIVTSPRSTATASWAPSCSSRRWIVTFRARGTADYLWSVKNVVPFLKVDKGLADEANGVQVMKPMPGLDALLARAKDKGIFGTKMRSVIKHADAKGIDDVVSAAVHDRQADPRRGLDADHRARGGHSRHRQAGAEGLLKTSILQQLDTLAPDQQVMLKLTIPSVDDFYADLVKHPESPARRCAVGRLLARRGECAARAQPRRDRELFAGAHRRADRAAMRQGIQRGARRRHREHLRGVGEVTRRAADGRASLLRPGRAVDRERRNGSCASGRRRASRVARAAPGAGRRDRALRWHGRRIRGARSRASAKRDAWARIDRFDPVDRESPFAVTLVQAITASDTMDAIVRHAVELGVGRHPSRDHRAQRAVPVGRARRQAPRALAAGRRRGVRAVRPQPCPAGRRSRAAVAVVVELSRRDRVRRARRRRASCRCLRQRHSTSSSDRKAD